MVAWQLTFPRSMADTDLISFLGSLHGLARAGWLIFDRPTITIETEASAGRIRHRLVVADTHASVVESVVRSTLPGVRLEEDNEHESVEFSAGVELTASSKFRALRMDDLPASSATVLASLQPLYRSETVRLQWVLAPAPSPRPPRVATKSRPRGLPDAELVAAHRQKQTEPLFLCAARIVVGGVDGKRAHHLIGRTYSMLRRAEAPGVALRRRFVSAKTVARRAGKRSAPLWSWGLTLNGAELAGVLGVPIGGPALPGLVVGSSRQLPLAPGASSSGITVAESTYPGDRRAIRLPLEMRRQHSLVVAPTGSGKSNLLASMVLQDIADGRGAVVLDPKADFVEDVLQRVPAERAGDVIVLDATDSEMPVGLNPIGLARNTEGQRELIVDNVVGTMHNLFRDSWGIRTEDVLRSVLMTMVATRAADGSAWTLADVPAVLANEPLRQHLAAQVPDPAVASFWSYFEGLSSSQQAEVAAPLQNKLRTVLLRPRIRRILGQSDGLDFFDLIQQRKILLVPLPKGQLGDESASLLGALVVAELWSAVMARTVIPKDKRSVFMAYVDEAHNFVHLPKDVGDMLAEARGLGLSLLLATQMLSQFPKPLQNGVLANARTKLMFNLPPSDAQVMAGFVKPALGADDLMGLPEYELVVHSDATGHSLTATGTTAVLEPATCSSDQIRQRSRAAHGVPAEDVDMAQQRRQELSRAVAEDRPEPARRRIGARRRSPGESAA